MNSCPPNSLAKSPENLSKWSSSPLHSDCPTLFIVGARKGGTTSLYQYVSKHPDFQGVLLDIGSKAGELYYFNKGNETQPAWHVYTDVFADAFKNKKMTGESSVAYLVECHVPQKLFSYCGNKAKVVMLLRNPVDRFQSNFLMRIRHGTNKNQKNISDFLSRYKDRLTKTLNISQGDPAIPPPDQWINLLCLFKPSGNLLFEGLYFVHLQNWLCNFPPDNILVVNSEEFFQYPQRVLKQVHEFIGLRQLSDNEYQSTTSVIYNKGFDAKYISEEQQFTREDKAILNSIYGPYNRALFKLLGWSQNTWK